MWILIVVILSNGQDMLLTKKIPTQIACQVALQKASETVNKSTAGSANFEFVGRCVKFEDL